MEERTHGWARSRRSSEHRRVTAARARLAPASFSHQSTTRSAPASAGGAKDEGRMGSTNSVYLSVPGRGVYTVPWGV
eukprot:440587-Prymnesium_polylepis.2